MSSVLEQARDRFVALQRGQAATLGRETAEILDALGRDTHPGLPSEALLVPLPSGLSSAYILADSLILSNEL